MRYFNYELYMTDDFPFKIEIKKNVHLNFQHAHEYMQICYVLKGTCIHHFNGKKADIIKGDLFSIPPNLEHRLEMKKEGMEQAEIVHIDFMPFIFGDNLQRFSALEHFVDFAFIQPFVELNDRLLPKLNLRFDAQQETERMVHEMIHEHEEQQEGYRLVIKSLLQKLLVVAGREYSRFIEDGNEPRIFEDQKKLFDQAIRYIDQHYMGGVKLADVAEIAGMSPPYFSTMFKLMQGVTFIDYLVNCRIQKAMKLLKETDQSVGDISFSIGFNHVTHFYRVFKKITGLTPAAYRRSSVR